MKRKEIKQKAKKCLTKNYIKCFVTSIFISILIGSLTFTPLFPRTISFINSHINISNNSSIVLEFVEDFYNTDLHLDEYKPTRGILAGIFNNITASKSFVFGLLNSLNQFIFHDHLMASVIILLGAILSFGYWFFIRNVLIVGEKRFFLENVYHPKTTFNRTLLPYKVKKAFNVALGMFRKSFFELLWAFTIIGGFIKHYAYLLIPYILAENPDIKPKEAMELSEKIMQNHKLELFKFDLSFIGWHILNLFTFNLLNIFFIMPYQKCCLANIYLNYKKEHSIALLNDTYLEIPSAKYPSDKFLYKEAESRKWLTTDYQKDYSLTSYILLFFSTAIIGCIWETSFHLFRYGSFVKRGVLNGPWLPIYGWGLIALLFILKKYRDKPVATFLLSMIICGLIEYFTSCYLEYFKHARWWDYDGYFLNIHGRVCLEGLLAFGIAGCAFIYFGAPLLDNLFSKINKKIKTILCIVLILSYVGDSIYSINHPNMGVGVNTSVPS